MSADDRAPAPQSASQTIGPFFHDALIRPGQEVLAGPGAQGRRIVLTGVVLDGDGAPVTDAMIELWQADANGRFAHPADPRHEDADPAFRGFGRARSGEDGTYRFETVLPGPLPPGHGGSTAPHANLHVFARGLLIHAVTRAFFEGEPGVDDDPVLASLPEARRGTLLARREAGRDDLPPRYRFDLVLQGPNETVFFEP